MFSEERLSELFDILYHHVDLLSNITQHSLEKINSIIDEIDLELEKEEK